MEISGIDPSNSLRLCHRWKHEDKSGWGDMISGKDKNFMTSLGQNYCMEVPPSAGSWKCLLAQRKVFPVYSFLPGNLSLRAVYSASDVAPQWTSPSIPTTFGFHPDLHHPPPTWGSEMAPGEGIPHGRTWAKEMISRDRAQNSTRADRRSCAGGPPFPHSCGTNPHEGLNLFSPGLDVSES